MKFLFLPFTFLLLILTLSKTNYAQAPVLGRVSTFVLFTSAGAFSNTGASVITGDIGTQVGALTGFPPGTVNGNIHTADSVTALAAANLGTAYTSLNALTCDSTIGATLGNGQILTPKVYCITTLASINGTLTLNALGNPNAVFVIKVNGALSTSIATQILLINSANFNNVYWQVNGAFTLGDSTVFKGTVIANGAISLLPSSSILGRGLTTAGAITIQNTNSVLPVKLMSFTANCNMKNIDFKWATASEYNNSYFTIESSANQRNWTAITKVNGNGTSNSLQTYTYRFLNQLPANTYYRLKQTDIDGNYSYSGVVVANPCNREVLNIDIYPNPTTGAINFSYHQDGDQSGAVSVYNMLGAKVLQTEGFPSAINFESQPNGIYFVHFTNNTQNVVKKIMVKHQ